MLGDVGQVKRIDVLPDDILLEIFDFYVSDLWYGDKRRREEWQILVHVCRRWRGLVLGSPRRLESASLLYTLYTRKGHTGRLASLASRRYRQYGLIGHGQRHCSTRAEQSHL